MIQQFVVELITASLDKWKILKIANNNFKKFKEFLIVILDK